jgi:hypothetical protein
VRSGVTQFPLVWLREDVDRVTAALDVNTDNEDVSDFAREMNVNYPIMIGNRSSFEKRYGGVVFLPMTYFLDRDGKDIAREVGVENRSVFVEHIKRSSDQAPAEQGQK